MIVNTKFFAYNGILVGNNDKVLGDKDTQYEVVVTTDGNGSASANPLIGYAGTLVNLSNSPNTGYEFDKYNVNGTDINTSSFTLQQDSTVLAKFAKLYNVNVTTDGNGTAAANPTSGRAGTTIQLSNTPNTRYAFDHYTVNGTSTTNNSFSLQQDTNVVAYFTRTPGGTDWYYDNEADTSKVQNRTLTSTAQMIVAHQKFTSAPNPANNQRQSWSNYGVCRCHWSGHIDQRYDTRASGLHWTVDAISGYSNADEIYWRAVDHYTVSTDVSNVAVSIVINFLTKKATIYTNNTASFTRNLNMQANGVYLAIVSTGYRTTPTLTDVSMKIFEDESDAIAFAKFQ